MKTTEELTKHAYEQLRAHILNGRLEPGAAVSQVQLAREFGVSRTPLREAIRLLQVQELVESEYNRRVRIATLTPSGCEQIYAMRIPLESLAVRLSVARMTEEELDEAERHLVEVAELSARGEGEAAREPHRAFHFLFFRHAGDQMKARLGDLWDHAERYRLIYQSASYSTESVERTTAEHDAILAAARARDEVDAMARVADHLGRVVLTTLAAMDSRYDPRAIRVALQMTDAVADAAPV